VFGGNGYMDESPMGRLYREAPVISIWEGSGNVMALDMLRAVSREPDAMGALIGDLAAVCRDDSRLRAHFNALPHALRQDGDTLEFVARREAQRLILLIQARLLREYAPAPVADAFIASRFDEHWGRTFGTLPAGLQTGAILERAFPG
jgi:putative acyl-CoA dehydrogenase